MGWINIKYFNLIERRLTSIKLTIFSEGLLSFELSFTLLLF